MNTFIEAAHREALGRRVDELTDELCRLGLAGAPEPDIEAAKHSLRVAVTAYDAAWRPEDYETPA